MRHELDKYLGLPSHGAGRAIPLCDYLQEEIWVNTQSSTWNAT